MDDPQFQQLLNFFGLSWEGYRKVRKGVKKCIARYMQEHAFREMGALLSALERDPDQRKQVEKLLTVSISRFFRDRGLWQAIERHVLPEIIAPAKKRIKVWSAGCACGEETYSFRILWEELTDRLAQMPELELWATDTNVEYLQKAQEGVYPSSSLKELSAELRSKYFHKGGFETRPSFWVIEPLKEGIFWEIQNLLSEDPPQQNFSIIFLRNNLLTYYEDELKIPAFRKVLTSLAPEGFLIIGAHERIPTEVPALFPSPHHPNIFQKTPFLSSPLRGRGRG